MFLTEIIELKKKRIETSKLKRDFDELKTSAIAARERAEKHRLKTALLKDQINIIAEIKRASPSKRVINDKIDVSEFARNYEKGGACAISVLTEEDRFCGSLEDLKSVRKAVNLPILRKDFIFDEFQIYEAAEAGADVILLIAAMLDDEILQKLPPTTTKLVIAHRLNTIANADVIYFVNSGNVTRAGSLNDAVEMLMKGKMAS